MLYLKADRIQPKCRLIIVRPIWGVLMRDGKHCPACGEDIGVWPIFSAGLPDLIWCPRCKARLGYRGLAGVGVVLSLLLVAVVVLGYVVAGRFEGNPSLVVFIAVFLGAWVSIELALVKYLRGNKVLECRSGGARPAEKDQA